MFVWVHFPQGAQDLSYKTQALSEMTHKEMLPVVKQNEVDNLRGVKRKVGETPDSSEPPGAGLQ